MKKIYTNVHTSVHPSVHTCVHMSYMCAYMCTDMCTCTNKCTYMCADMFMYRHVHSHACRHVDRQVFRHVYKHVYRKVFRHVYRQACEGHLIDHASTSAGIPVWFWTLLQSTWEPTYSCDGRLPKKIRRPLSLERRVLRQRTATSAQVSRSRSPDLDRSSSC